MCDTVLNVIGPHFKATTTFRFDCLWIHYFNFEVSFDSNLIIFSSPFWQAGTYNIKCSLPRCLLCQNIYDININFY